jgi:hypothetical protein
MVSDKTSRESSCSVLARGTAPSRQGQALAHSGDSLTVLLTDGQVRSIVPCATTWPTLLLCGNPAWGGGRLALAILLALVRRAFDFRSAQARGVVVMRAVRRGRSLALGVAVATVGGMLSSVSVAAAPAPAAAPSPVVASPAKLGVRHVKATWPAPAPQARLFATRRELRKFVMGQSGTAAGRPQSTATRNAELKRLAAEAARRAA